MGNYTYIDIEGECETDISKAIPPFENILKTVVKQALGDRWVVTFSEFEDDGPVWIVSLPNSASEPKEKDRLLPWICQEGDLGFPVALQPGRIAFRHAGLVIHHEELPPMFVRWAQGCVEEEMSEHLGLRVFYDATEKTYPPGSRRYRAGTPFQEYMSKLFKSADEQDTPKGSSDGGVVPPS